MNNNYEFYMSADLSKYVGKWVAICESSIVSEGGDAKKVFNEAKKACKNKKILLTRIPKESTMIF